MIVFSRTDLPVPDGPSITQISPAGTVRRDVAPDQLFAEALGQVLDLDLDTHREPPSLLQSDLGLVGGVRMDLPTHAYQRVARG